MLQDHPVQCYHVVTLDFLQPPIHDGHWPTCGPLPFIQQGPELLPEGLAPCPVQGPAGKVPSVAEPLGRNGLNVSLGARP